jgi:hypothetical protein
MSYGGEGSGDESAIAKAGAGVPSYAPNESRPGRGQGWPKAIASIRVTTLSALEAGRGGWTIWSGRELQRLAHWSWGRSAVIMKSPRNRAKRANDQPR